MSLAFDQAWDIAKRETRPLNVLDLTDNRYATRRFGTPSRSLRALNLLSGAGGRRDTPGGWTKPYLQRGHQALQMDLMPELNANITGDINMLAQNPDIFQSALEQAGFTDAGPPDIVLASPVCKPHSVAGGFGGKMRTVNDPLHPAYDGGRMHNAALKNKLLRERGRLDPEEYIEMGAMVRDPHIGGRIKTQEQMDDIRAQQETTASTFRIFDDVIKPLNPDAKLIVENPVSGWRFQPDVLAQPDMATLSQATHFNPFSEQVLGLPAPPSLFDEIFALSGGQTPLLPNLKPTDLVGDFPDDFVPRPRLAQGAGVLEGTPVLYTSPEDYGIENHPLMRGTNPLTPREVQRLLWLPHQRSVAGLPGGVRQSGETLKRIEETLRLAEAGQIDWDQPTPGTYMGKHRTKRDPVTGQKIMAEKKLGMSPVALGAGTLYMPAPAGSSGGSTGMPKMRVLGPDGKPVTLPQYLTPSIIPETLGLDTAVAAENQFGVDIDWGDRLASGNVPAHHIQTYIPSRFTPPTLDEIRRRVS